MPRMQRTNVVLDQELVDEVKHKYGFRTTRETIDYALRQVVGKDVDPYALALELQGSMILPPLEELRGESPIEEI
jgi:Arc/MetJ family transcription regulator